MLNSANMYPWYRDSMSQLGQFCSGNNLPAPTAAHIKTENGYSDCMLALDYAQNKVRIKPAQRLEIDARARKIDVHLFTNFNEPTTNVYIAKAIEFSRSYLCKHTKGNAPST